MYAKSCSRQLSMFFDVDKFQVDHDSSCAAGSMQDRKRSISESEIHHSIDGLRSGLIPVSIPRDTF